jgi:hypothetical protein
MARLELLRLGFIPNSWWSLEQVFSKKAAATLAQAKRKHRAAREDRVSFSRAIENGRPATEGELARYRDEAQRSEARPSASLPSPHRPPATLEQQAFIDLKPLHMMGWLAPGQLTGWHLAWSAELTGFDDILMFVDLRDEAAMKLRLEFAFSGRGVRAHQTISLVRRPSMPGRMFLQCPILGTTHRMLFLRDGLFASAKAQRLRHLSQAP